MSPSWPKFVIAGLLGIIVAVIAVLYIIPEESVSEPEKQATKLYLNWIFSGSFAGEAVAVEKTASENGLQLSLIEGGQGRDPLKLVRDNEFGIASSDEIIRAIENGADLVIIGVVNDDHPAAFVSLADSGIKQPKDFIGKRVGLLPFGSTGLIYQALLKIQLVDRNDIKEVVVSPDIRTFVSGRVIDVQPIFIFDETVTLDELGIAYNLIVPRDYGVKFKGPSYFTTRHTLIDNPELVRAFIATMIDAWQFTNAAPSEAILALKSIAPNIDEKRERELLDRAIIYYVDGSRNVLDSEKSTWVEFISNLKEFGHTRNLVKPMEVLDLSFVRQHHAGS